MTPESPSFLQGIPILFGKPCKKCWKAFPQKFYGDVYYKCDHVTIEIDGRMVAEYKCVMGMDDSFCVLRAFIGK